MVEKNKLKCIHYFSLLRGCALGASRSPQNFLLSIASLHTHLAPNIHLKSQSWPRVNVSRIVILLDFSTRLFDANYIPARAPNTRAARRAASPSLDVDRSLINAPRMESSPEPRSSALSDRSGAGIQKKQKQKRMSRAQRMRQQKGMDRAEAVLDQLEIKKARSLNRGKTVKARRV